MKIDEIKLEAFVRRAIGDLAASMSGVMTTIGHKLGLYKAMASSGPLTSTELADKTGTSERYLREWLNNQAAGGYVSYDPETDAYALPDEHAIVLADPDSPAFIPPAFETVASLCLDEDKITKTVRDGHGRLARTSPPTVLRRRGILS